MNSTSQEGRKDCKGNIWCLKNQHIPMTFQFLQQNICFPLELLKWYHNKLRNNFLSCQIIRSKGRVSKSPICICIHILVAEPNNLLFLQFYPLYIPATIRISDKRWRALSLCIQIHLASITWGLPLYLNEPLLCVFMNQRILRKHGWKIYRGTVLAQKFSQMSGQVTSSLMQAVSRYSTGENYPRILVSVPPLASLFWLQYNSSQGARSVVLSTLKCIDH